jgi:GINS complex subunit 2
LYDEEKKNSDSFQKLPWHWLEIGLALIDGAADDLQSPANTLRTLLQDIREVRQSKARTGMTQINESDLQMDDLSLLEINEMRPFMVMMMDQLRRMKIPVDDQENV